jgi:hypothetical protein
MGQEILVHILAIMVIYCETSKLGQVLDLNIRLLFLPSDSARFYSNKDKFFYNHIVRFLSLHIEAVGFINEDGTVIVYYDDSNNQGLFVKTQHRHELFGVVIIDFAYDTLLVEV